MFRLTSIKTFLLVFVIAASLDNFAPARGDDTAKLKAFTEAHDLLMKAHDETDVAQRVSDLKEANHLIWHAAPMPQGPERDRARGLIDSAIYQLKQGDPQNVVNQYIERANRAIGF